MTLDQGEAKAETTYLECRYHFCSTTCQEKFTQNPRLYLSDSSLGS
jgi:YHS domain-containing protein